MMYHTTHTQPEITIRPATPADQAELRRLAQLDSSQLPEGDLLVAAVGGEIRAAVCVQSGNAIADPFHRSAELVRMLSLRVDQLRAPTAPRRRRLRRVLRAA
jgi:hypothetical protein